MMNLRVCDDPPLDYFDAIAAAKQPPRSDRLIALRSSIASAYRHYHDKRLELESLLPLPLSEQDRDALLHCYNEKTAPLARLKNRIKSCQPVLLQAECQYCCLGAPETYDHYLPKGSYPEFSTCSYNLLPCCADCNLLRGEAWRSDSGERMHVNLYFDLIDQNEEILFAEINITRLPSATFRLDLARARTRSFHQLLERHFTQLRLLERYRQAAPARLNEYHRTLHTFGRGLNGLGKVTSILRDQLAQDKRDRGPHDWRVALLRAVLDTPEFIHFALDTSPSIWTE